MEWAVWTEEELKKNPNRENQPQELLDLFEANLRELFQRKYDLSSDVGHSFQLDKVMTSGEKEFVIVDRMEYRQIDVSNPYDYQLFKWSEVMHKKDYLLELELKKAEEEERIHQEALLKQEINDKYEADKEEYLRGLEEAENARMEEE